MACGQAIVGGEGGVGEGVVDAVACSVGGVEEGENMAWEAS